MRTSLPALAALLAALALVGCGDAERAAAPPAPRGEQWARCAERWHAMAREACATGTWPSGATAPVDDAAAIAACRLGFVIGDRERSLVGYARRCEGEEARFQRCADTARAGARRRCRDEGRMPDGTRFDPGDAAARERCEAMWRDGTGAGAGAGFRGWQAQCAGAAQHL
jgi:hypothetical protein